MARRTPIFLQKRQKVPFSIQKHIKQPQKDQITMKKKDHVPQTQPGYQAWQDAFAAAGLNESMIISR